MPPIAPSNAPLQPKKGENMDAYKVFIVALTLLIFLAIGFIIGYIKGRNYR